MSINWKHTKCPQSGISFSLKRNEVLTHAEYGNCAVVSNYLQPQGLLAHRHLYMGFLKVRILEWVAIPFAEIYLTWGSNPDLLHYRQILCIAGRYHSTREAHCYNTGEPWAFRLHPLWNQIKETETACNPAASAKAEGTYGQLSSGSWRPGYEWPQPGPQRPSCWMLLGLYSWFWNSQIKVFH